jgi:predicted nucleic acid-binding protein
MRELRNAGLCYVSAITRFEMLVGAGERTVRDTLRFVDRFGTIEIDAGTADRAGRLGWTYRATHNRKTADLLMAATAIQHRLVLVTYNGGDFPMSQVRLYPVPSV